MAFMFSVDYCARSLSTLLFKDRLEHDCYHVTAGPNASACIAEIDRAFSRALNRGSVEALQVFGLEELPQMERDFERWFGPCNVTRAAGAIRVYTAFARLNVTFDNHRLLSEGVPQSESFPDYVGACVHSTLREAIADEMAHDMR